jgi:hypothetical protein
MKHDLKMGRVEFHSDGIKLDSVGNRGFIIRISGDLIKDFKEQDMRQEDNGYVTSFMTAHLILLMNV